MSRFSVDRLSVLQKNNANRLSMLLNEDDYDYALELGPDDEYRQAAEALPKLVDFDDIDLSNLVDEDEVDVIEESKQNETIQPFANLRQTRASITEMNTQRNRMSNFDTSMLEMHATTAKSRRSSVQANQTTNEAPSHWGAVEEAENEQDEPEVDEDGDLDFENDQNNTEYDPTITGMGMNHGEAGLGVNFNATGHSATSSGDSSFTSRWKSLSKKEFSFRLNMLKQHRKWVERAARRSSIGFHRHHPSSDKEAMDRFLVALAGGVHVRRHQGYRFSEIVRLYSVTGCRTIEWDKPKAKDLHAQRHKAGVLTEGGTNAIFNSKYDKSVFDCCIAVCGCGDDLNAGHDGQHKHSNNNMNANDVEEDVRYVNFGRTFYNIGYRRRGTFRDLDVIAVHPAGKEDPTVVGMLGTECLRHTKDVFNVELTFSVVVRDTTSSVGYSTLDIECESADNYYLLLRGFRLLQEEAEVHRQQSRPASGLYSTSDDLEAGNGNGQEGLDNNNNNNNVSSNNNSNGGGSFKQHQRIEELSYIWNSIKGYVTGGAWESPSVLQDPISDLFAPTNSIDPLRALRVGGGLIPKHSAKVNNNNINGVNSPASPVSPSLLRSIGVHLGIQNNTNTNNTTNTTSNTHTNKQTTNTSSYTNQTLPLAQFLGWNSAGTQVWARLKMAGLDVKCVLSWDLKRVILKVRCPAWRLEQMAEQMHLKLKSRDGYLKQFKVNRRDTFVAMGAGGSMFRSSERQQIIDYIIRSKIKDGGAELDEYTELGKEIVQRFPLHMYSKLHDISHTWVTFWKQNHHSQVSPAWSPFRASYQDSYHRICNDVDYFMSNLLTQPLDSIAEYFGESIAFYFAYMAFYTRWLVFPSVLGVIVFAVQVSSDRLDHWLCPLYAIVVMIWACFMLAFWRQKASALAHRWGVLDYEVEETERPQFRGAYTYDESSGEVRKTYSLWKRTGKYFISIPVLAIAILVTLLLMTTVFYSQDQMVNDYVDGKSVNFSPQFPSFGEDSHSDNGGDDGTSGNSNGGDGKTFSLSAIYNSNFWAATFFYPCLYGVLVSLLTIVFEFIAVWLNDYENHRTQTTYLNRLILKVFSFQFVTIFTSLYYYAFFMRNSEGAFYQICITVFSLMTVGQWWQVFLDIAVPSIYHRALLYRMRSAFANTNRKIYAAREYTDRKVAQSARRAVKDENIRTLNTIMSEKLDKRHDYLEQAKSKCWEEALQAKYNNFADYTRMVIQIGFVLFFSAVFPLCPLFALLNNIALIRLNALKICYTRQRPIAQKIGGIGVWEDVLQIMSVGGILTNCALYGFTSNIVKDVLVPSVGKIGMAMILFAYEHTILLFKYWLHSSIPSVHPSVQRARTRERKTSDRKSLLRSQKNSKHKRNSLFGGDTNPTTHLVGHNNTHSGSPAKKKPLRAQGSMLGYWFDLSASKAGGHQCNDDTDEVIESTHGMQMEDRDSNDEQSSLIPSPSTQPTTTHIHSNTPFNSQTKRASVTAMGHPLSPHMVHDTTPYATHTNRRVSEHKAIEYKQDSSSEEEQHWDPDLPPDSPYRLSPYTVPNTAHHNDHARCALDANSDEDIPPDSGSDTDQELLHKNDCNTRAGKVPFNAQPFSHASNRSGRASLSPPRSTKVNTTITSDGTKRNSTTGRRSLSPTRLKNTTITTNPTSSNMDTVTRDEMIRLIRANIEHSVQTPVQVHINMHLPAAPTTTIAAPGAPVVVPSVAPVPNTRQSIVQVTNNTHIENVVQPSRRVSFLDHAALEARAEPYPTAPAAVNEVTQQEYYEYEDYGSEDEVSDLSEEYAGEDNRPYYTNNTSHGYTNSGESTAHPFAHLTNSNGEGLYTTPQKTGANVKYSPLQIQHPSTINNATAQVKSVTNTPIVIAPSMNVQNMLTNWFWPSKATTNTTATASAAKATHHSTPHKNNKHALNIAPLGNKGTTKTTTNTNTPSHTNNTTATGKSVVPQFSSPSAFFQLNDAVSPYMELLSPSGSPLPVSSKSQSNNNDSNKTSDSSGKHNNTSVKNALNGAAQGPRAVSPQRLSKAHSSTHSPRSTTKAHDSTNTPKRTPTRTSKPQTPQQVQSPFSYAEELAVVNYNNNNLNCMENEKILANLPTEQLHQLLLLQQQAQAQVQGQGQNVPQKRKSVVTSQHPPHPAGVITSPHLGTSNNNSNANSPPRSALAGSRKKQQQTQPQQGLKGGENSPNPYHPLLHTALSPAHLQALELTSASAAVKSPPPVPGTPAPLFSPQGVSEGKRRSSTRYPNATTPIANNSNHNEAHMPRRRISNKNSANNNAAVPRTPGSSIAQAYLNAVGSAQKTPVPAQKNTPVGHSQGEHNPFLFAVQRKPERVTYD